MADISERARILLKTLVECHIRDGQPVGSRTLLEEAGLPVSTATIRNVMQDLEFLGLLDSPHVSAGRIPTQVGLRIADKHRVGQQEIQSLNLTFWPFDFHFWRDNFHSADLKMLN